MRREALAGKLYYYEETLIPAPPTVKRERKGWWRVARAVAAGILAVTVAVIAYLSLCTKIVEEQYALDRAEARLPELHARNSNLEIQVKALSSLGRVDRIARNNLHMSFPRERLMIREDSQSPLAEADPSAWRFGKKIAWP